MLQVREDLGRWGLDIGNQMIQVTGRKLPTEQVFFKDQRSDGLRPFDVDPHKGDFTNAFRGGLFERKDIVIMLVAIRTSNQVCYNYVGARLVTCTPLNTWVLIVPQRDAGGVDNLLKTMQTVSRPLGFNISQPAEM